MSTPFQKKLASTAVNQFDLFRNYNETQKPLRDQIERYWEDIGLNFKNVGVPWSAVFVSWCVQKAGASDSEFTFSALHAVFVNKAIADTNNAAAKFKGHHVKDYAPKIGDIIQNNRLGNTFDFEHAKDNNDYPSHTAIVVAVASDAAGNYLLTIGGNEGDSVGRRRIALTSQGKIKQPNKYPEYFISVIETLK